jgi:hypothetical protein
MNLSTCVDLRTMVLGLLSTDPTSHMQEWGNLSSLIAIHKAWSVSYKLICNSTFSYPATFRVDASKASALKGG